MQAFTISPTFNDVVAVIVELWHSRWHLRISSTRTYKTDVANLKYVETSRRYWNKAELPDVFIDGKSYISISRGKRNSLPNIL